MTAELHFSLGPVQGFVAQARRTRDLWAGSWLLSYLAESAIAAAERAGAVMILPYRADPDRGVVTMHRDTASLRGFPNRFAARADDPVAAARAAEDGLRAAWQRIAEAVWRTYVARAAASNNGTRAIWDRQVASFWEVAWVVGGGRELAARKRVRLVDARVEPGVHGALMGELQELSGHYGPGSRARQDAFWQAVREGTPVLDLEEGERLSAIELIKRLFPHVASDAIGCDLPAMLGWPSTAWLAAAPWIARARQRAPAESSAFARSVATLRRQDGFRGEREAAHRRFRSDSPDGFAALDGPLFFEASLASPCSLELPDGTDTAAQRAALGRLYSAVGSAPEPFYAVLLMDGDRLGALLSQAREADPARAEQRISGALARFSDGVDGVVRGHDGYTVYAGGDDVLALLPADRALGCAEALAVSYPAAFREEAGCAVADRATISGVIVFAHFKKPLRSVLQYAHHLLDAVAKDATGRGALAIGILQSSGETARWSAPWEVVRGELDGAAPLRELIREFGENGALNPSYLYSLHARLSTLFDHAASHSSGFVRLPSGMTLEVVEAVARAEYGRVVAHRDGGPQSEPTRVPESPMQRLMSLTRRWHRCPHGTVDFYQTTFGFHGVRVARFLARVADADAPAPSATTVS